MSLNELMWITIGVLGAAVLALVIGAWALYADLGRDSNDDADEYISDLHAAVREDDEALDGQLKLWETGQMPVADGINHAPEEWDDWEDDPEYYGNWWEADESPEVSHPPTEAELKAAWSAGELKAEPEPDEVPWWETPEVKAALDEPVPHVEPAVAVPRLEPEPDQFESTYVREWREELNQWVAEQKAARAKWREEVGLPPLEDDCA